MTSPGLIFAAIDHFPSIDHADDGACEIVFARCDTSRASAQSRRRAARSPPLDRRGKDREAIAGTRGGSSRFAADVIEEEQRTRADHGDVIDAMIHEILPDRVVLVHREGDLQLRADAIDARDEHWLVHPGKVRAK